MRDTLLNFVHSDTFYLSLRRVVGVVLPLVALRLAGYPQIGMTIMGGALIVMGLDLPLNFRRKAKLIGTAALLNTAIILINVLIVEIDWLLALFLFSVLFSLSFVSLFSEPYNLMTIFATLAILISMGSSVDTLWEWLELGGLTLAGAGWYFLYTSFWHYVAHPWALMRQLRASLALTADYLELQADSITDPYAPEEWLRRHLDMRNRLLAQKAQLEKLLAEEFNFIYRYRDNYAPLFEGLEILVQIWDRALGHSFDFEQLHRSQGSDRQETIIINRQQQLVDILRNMAQSIHPTGLGGWKAREIPPLSNCANPSGRPIADELIAYQHRTYHCIQALQNKLLADESTEGQHVPLPFYTGIYDPDVRWPRLRRALNWKSRAFRHAFRIALVGVSGYFIGRYFELSNPSWILLTSVVILKPDYRTSKQRFSLRIIGTLIGVLIGVGLHVLDLGPYGEIAVFALSLQLAFAFIERNYAISSALFSVFILFLYAYQQIDFFESALFRVVDTLIGAFLAFVSVRYLITFWEHQALPRRVRRNFQSQRDLVRQFPLLGKGSSRQEERDYDLAQERAFARQREMQTAIDRMRAEPLNNRPLRETYEQLLMASEQQLILLATLGDRLRYYPATVQHKRMSTFLKDMESKLDQLAESWALPDQYTTLSEERTIETNHPSFQPLLSELQEHTRPQADHPAFRIFPLLGHSTQQLKTQSNRLQLVYSEHIPPGNSTI